MPSNISGRTNTIVNINTVSCNLPLVLSSDNNTTTTTSLSNLNSYGSSNQILKMNGQGTALEYGDDTNIEYTSGINITINNLNQINCDITNNNKISNGREFISYSSLNAVLPLYYNSGEFSISGITDIGLSNQYLKVDNSGNTMEWGTLPTPITHTSPLQLTNNDVKINLQSITAESSLLINSLSLIMNPNTGVNKSTTLTHIKALISDSCTASLPLKVKSNLITLHIYRLDFQTPQNTDNIVIASGSDNKRTSLSGLRTLINDSHTATSPIDIDSNTDIKLIGLSRLGSSNQILRGDRK